MLVNKNTSVVGAVIITAIVMGLAFMMIINFDKRSVKPKPEIENLIMPVDTLGVTDRGVKIFVYVIDGCEYIGNMNEFQTHDLTHKGDCCNEIHKTNYKTFFKK